MSDQSKQSRQPAGVPVGGQFAANDHDEASAPLNAGSFPEKRSFLYPPYLPDAQAVIDYYDGIEIDDATVSKFVDAYGAARANWAEDHLTTFDLELQRKYDGDKAKVEAAHWAEFRRIEQEHPTFVNPIFARDITKAVQMSRIATWSLSDEERDKLMSHEVTLTNGDRQPVSFFSQRYLVGQYEADLI